VTVHPWAPTKKLPIDLARVDTFKGGWLIAVEHCKDQRRTNLLLKIVFEQSIDEESSRAREHGMVVDARGAHDPDQCPKLLARIREWD
jgi:hypothetical protein